MITAPRPAAALPPKNDLAFVAALAGSCALIVAALLLLVGVRTAQIRVGYRVHDLEAEAVKLQQERSALEVERASLLRPQRLAELSRTTLGLVPVDAQHLLDVNAPAVVAPVPDEDAERGHGHGHGHGHVEEVSQ